MLRDRSRKNTASAGPPANGGFSVVRACASTLAVLLALCAVGGIPAGAGRLDRAAAQGAPAGDTGDLVNQIVTLDSEINGLNARLSDLEDKSAALSGRIQDMQQQVERNRERLSVQKKALGARARSLYMNGRSSKLVMLVSSRDVSDFYRRTEMLEKVAARDAQLIGEVKRESDLFDAQVTELTRKKREVDSVAAELSSREKRLESTKAEKQSALARAGAARQDVVARSSSVEQKMEQLNPPAPVTGRPTGKVMTMVATAYSPEEPGLDDNTASGMKATRGVVAVDPRVIPLGTRLHVEGYGNAIAGDTGSAIKGNRIDVCFDTLEEMNSWGGYRTVRVEILD